MSRLRSLLRFQPVEGRAMHGLAVIFDLEGFTQFCNQPGAARYVSRYMNEIMRAIHLCIYGGEHPWTGTSTEHTRLLAPIHQKFLGDGALLLWAPERMRGSFDPEFVITLINRLWNLKNFFTKVNDACQEHTPIIAPPQKIRFGIASGTIYRLETTRRDGMEYVGAPINLAARLQNYCSEIGFIVSANVGFPSSELDKHGYTRALARRIRGFPGDHEVIVDQSELEALGSRERTALFRPLAD